MKKYIFKLLIIAFIFCYANVLEKEKFDNYTNEYGVTLTESEYEFLTKLYWDEYPSLITKDEYEKIKKLNIFNQDVITKTITDSSAATRGSIHTTANKQLKIAVSCSSTCYVSVTLTWLNNPRIRSYDVIGAYFNGSGLSSNITTKISSSNTSFIANDTKKESQGFGTSFKLPSGSNIIINQSFYANKGGTIYASYQHATSNTTLATSQNYNFSHLGYGHVFLFNGNAKNIYDAMKGVDITI